MERTRFIITLSAFLVVAATVHLVLPPLVSRTKNRLDDLISRALTLPLILLGLAAAIWQSRIAPKWWSVKGFSLGWEGRLPLLIAILLLVWVVQRRIAGRLLKKFSATSANEIDDVAIPILTQQVFPALLVIVAVLALFWVFGGNIAAGIATAGGLSFILVYLLQEPLSNLFAGLSLALDVPFTYGDLVTLEDGRTYEVRRVGMRVTHLYDIGENNLVYLPNNRVTQQRLINLVQPNVEQRLQIVVSVAYENIDVDLVQQILFDIALAHPHVLGTKETKTDAIAKSLLSASPTKVPHLQFQQLRLQREHEVRELGEDTVRALRALSGSVDAATGHLHTATMHATLETTTSLLTKLHLQATEWALLLGLEQITYRNEFVFDEQTISAWLASESQQLRKIPPRQFADEAEFARKALSTFAKEQLHIAISWRQEQAIA